MAIEPRLTLVVALPSEARPLVDAFTLTAASERPFRSWGDARMTLVVSGVGHIASAAAVGWCAGRAPPRRGDVWLNVGIAGHRRLPRGSCVLAGAVAHHTLPERHYPGLLFNTELPLVTVTTHAQPVTHYPDESCVDMEAWGFAQAALKFADADLIHVIKVVSDNAGSGIGHISRAYVDTLIGDASGRIGEVIAALRAVAAALPADDSAAALAPYFAAAHFSFTQRARLQQLYRRWRACHGEAVWPPAQLPTGAPAAETLAALDALLPPLPE